MEQYQSGIGEVKNLKGTAEENGGHISQRIAEAIRKSNKRRKPKRPMETNAKQTHSRSMCHIRQLSKPPSLHAKTRSSKNKTQVSSLNDRDGEDGGVNKILGQYCNSFHSLSSLWSTKPIIMVNSSAYFFVCQLDYKYYFLSYDDNCFTTILQCC